MKIKILLLLILLNSCASRKKPEAKLCNENLAFKTEFFKNIEIVENLTLGKSKDGNLSESLKFISKYSKVSYNKLLNYAFIYNNQESYRIDKENWLKWYEENKCNYIQFK